MAYGDSNARAARFVNQAGNGINSIIQEGKDAEKELYGGNGPQTPGLPPDMQIIQGVTDDIYKQYAAAEDFAQTMWKNYRIDVTKPDLRNPIGIKAHDLYQQAISGVMYAGDALKQSNSLLAKDREAAREGKGVILQNPSENVYGLDTPEDSRFVNTQLDPRAGQSNNAYAKSYDTQSATNQANTQVGANRAQTVGMYNDLGMPNRAAIVGGQFEQGIHDQPQFNPNTGRGNGGLTPDIAKNIYDQLTNYKIGILNNDKGILGALKNNFPGILDVRPVNTPNKQGAYITRKAGEQKVTSFVDLSNADPTQGTESLFYILQTANPAKFKVDANEMVPYLQQTTFEGGTPPQTQPAMDEMNLLFKHSTTSKDSPVKLDNGKSITITADDKKAFADKLDKLAVQGELRLPNGEQIIDVEWKDLSKWYQSEKQRLVIHLMGDEEPIELDPNKSEDQDLFQQIIEMNSGALVDPTLWEQSKTPYINSQTINPNKGSNIDVNKQSQASSAVDMFEQSKKK